MIQKLKNFLKRILPPPVRTFMREIERVLAEIRGQGGRHSRELEALNTEIAALREDQHELSQQLQTMRNEVSAELRDIRDTQQQAVLALNELKETYKQTAVALSGIQEMQKQTFGVLTDFHEMILHSFATYKEKIASDKKEVTDTLDVQGAALTELRKQIQRLEHNVFEKINREKMEFIYEYYSRLPSELYEKELALWYRKGTGKKLNIKNPKTFNEKIQWMKLYDNPPIKTRLSDKLLVREWVKSKIGEEYLIPLLGVWDCFDDIDFDNLPNQFALKTNHGSGWNLIVKDKTKMDKTSAKRNFDAWIKKNHAFHNGFEMQYLNIAPKILAEKYIENTEGLIDYRFFCFGGKPEQVWVDIYSGTPQHLRSVYDMQWRPISLQCSWPSGGDLLSKKPKNFEKMIEFAMILSKDFSFVRVDFFEVDEMLYMGEMTFTPMSGLGKFYPSSWDDILGEMITLPEKTEIPELEL